MGFLSVAGATSAGAAGAKSPKAAASAVTSVRAGVVGQIPSAMVTLPAAMPRPTTLQVAGAPSNTATVYLNDGPATNNYPVSTDDSATLLRSEAIAASLSDDSVLGIAVDTAGTYTVRLGNGSDTTTASFVTTGVPASISWNPTSQTVLVGATATMQLALKDAAGNLTQAALGDTIAVAASADDTPSDASVTAAEIYAGTAVITATAQAGTQTITATPLGTLPPAVVAASTTLTGSGTVSTSLPKSIKVTAPATALSTPPNTDDTVGRAVAVPVGTAAVTFTIDDTTANAAGQKIRFKLQPSAGAVTVDGLSGSNASPLFVDVTTDADKKATISATLSGDAILATANVVLTQVNVLNSQVGSGAVTVTQTVGSAVVTVSPDDSVVAKLGDSVPVTVTVTDQFGAPQAGWIVRAFRGATVSGTFLTQATTGAAGTASVSVTSLAGATAPVVEQYSFSATPTIGSAANANNAVQVTYTADGTIASLSVTPTPTTDPAAITNTTTTQVTGPLLTVPYDGTANTVTGQTYTVATGAAVSGGAAGEVASFVVNPSTPTPVTAQVPLGSTGIYVSNTASTLWSAGQSSVTVGAGETVYVFGTKVGEHVITFSAGGKDVAVKVKVQTSSSAAYNMALTPLEQEVSAGGITTATLTVTDVFGNAVTTTDDSGAVTVTASGGVLLAGYQTSASYTTGASGTATITVIAGNAAGVGTLAATPKTGQKAPAWVSPYTKPAGAPDPTTSAAAEVIVTSAPVERTIVIQGERTTVKGASGIAVDGLTTGFADGDTVKPFVRFPGGSYTEGTARPAVEGDEFYWERKTGKKTYVFFTASDDELVKSNRIIIAAK